MGSVDVHSNGKRSFRQIKSTFRISFHSARHLQLPEMRGPRSQISIFCFECCHPACMPAASISVTGNLWDGCQICTRMEGVVILLRIDVKATTAVNEDLHFSSSAIHCELLCPIPLTSSPLRSIIHHNTNQHCDLAAMAETDSFLHHQQDSQRSSDWDMRRRCNPTNIPECKFTPAMQALPGVLLGNNHQFSTAIVKTGGKPTMEQGRILGKHLHRLKLFKLEDKVPWASPFSD